VAFFLKQHSPAECSYTIYNMELMTIIHAFEEWRAFAERSLHVIEVLTDHKNLEYLTTNRLLNRHQARWAEFLLGFNFKIIYHPKIASVKPDALTRKSGNAPGDNNECTLCQEQTILKPHNLLLASAALAVPLSDDSPPPTPPVPIFSDPPLCLSVDELFRLAY
jgi:hypothetical protein